ncbi:hypothetical protein [Thalassobacillus pellis]|uniref:hypothetical protein n=1 Tax=Thalassobacillus pellis TaxID=748008 RepID=UPI001961E2E1|nr:hypothetical protein [Thalassobacillus pellis]MBM7553867.1 hypothetical protein [Thalassobacillus pellis]
MYLNHVNNLHCNSKLSLKQVEDRLIITADFPKDFLVVNELLDPFLYVTLYVRGGARIKIIDEGTVNVYALTRKDVAEETYEQIIKFARLHAPQFKNFAN